MKKPELLAPGGNPAKAKTALIYGADAVYVGGQAFGLRANADNFTVPELADLCSFAHGMGKNVYLTLNILPRTSEIKDMCRYAKEVEETGVDGLIVSDLGAFMALRKAVPDIPVHVSTQASTLNAQTCAFWYDQGAERVNLARELKLSEIEEIHNDLEAMGKGGLGLEVFVHGAMCMSYSGRCMLSDYMTGRSSNRGDCAQPCRWKYHVPELETRLFEDERKGEEFYAVENDQGTFLFNSKDLCLIEYIPELINAGATALKIEGRMKSDFYVAVTVKAYRAAIDYGSKMPPEMLESLLYEVCSVSHRDYSTGFLFDQRGSQVYSSSSYIRKTDFAGIVTSCKASSDKKYDITISQRGNFGASEILEFVSPTGPVEKCVLGTMTDDSGESVERASHACMNIHASVPFFLPEGTIVRRPK